MTIEKRGRRPAGRVVAFALVAGLICAAASIPATLPRPAVETAEAGARVAAPSKVAPVVVAPATQPPSHSVTKPADLTDPTLDPDPVLLGSWTVVYEVGGENGDGANIEIPLRRLDGMVIEPGATFDFWTAVGEVSRRTGYRQGGVIVGNHIDPDGALAGGICTVSTAIFNAAARAGLRILSRTSHGGYVAKYPLGLDAAVSKSDRSRQTMAFRNDTPERIVMRTASSPGIARVDLYGAVALGRQIMFSRPAASHRRHAHDAHEPSASRARGQHKRVEAASDGMTVVVTRTVRDTGGRVIHRDRWVSTYRPLTGVVLDGTS
jgi:vancomycin resistance protein YoaR